jgi:cytochrome c6
MDGLALAKLEKARPQRFSKAALGAALCVASVAANAGDPLRGADLYRQHCSACHGAGGKPVLPTAPDFTRPTALLKPDLALMASIRQGRGAMPAYDGVLRERDILDIVAHLRTLR